MSGSSLTHTMATQQDFWLDSKLKAREYPCVVCANAYLTVLVNLLSLFYLIWFQISSQKLNVNFDFPEFHEFTVNPT